MKHFENYSDFHDVLQKNQKYCPNKNLTPQTASQKYIPFLFIVLFIFFFQDSPTEIFCQMFYHMTQIFVILDKKTSEYIISSSS